MNDSRIVPFILITLILFLLVWHYGRAGLDGILKRKMYYSDLPNRNSFLPPLMNKAEGTDALYKGILFVVLSVLGIVGWLICAVVYIFREYLGQ